MIQAPTEVSEAQAEGVVKTIYGEIKDTFRVPVVNLVFRVLATHPDYLQLAWTALQPNVQTVFFEQRADAVRRLAAETMSAMGRPPAPSDEALATLRVFHYVNPKLLVAVAALRVATSGSQPQVIELPREEKRQIAPGVPPEAGTIEMIDPATAAPEVRAIFDDLRATLQVPVINSDYLALARWPEYFGAAWEALRSLTQRPEYRQVQRALRFEAEQTVTALPYRMNLSPHVLRHAGLSEADIDFVRGTLDTFYRLLPGLVANVSFLSGALGREQALQSPFPPRVL